MQTLVSKWNDIVGETEYLDKEQFKRANELGPRPEIMIRELQELDWNSKVEELTQIGQERFFHQREQQQLHHWYTHSVNVIHRIYYTPYQASHTNCIITLAKSLFCQKSLLFGRYLRNRA